MEEAEPHEHGERSDERKEEVEPHAHGENSLIFLTDYLFLFTIFVQCLTNRVSPFVCNISFTPYLSLRTLP